jgi:hypothetical protein
MSRWASSHLPPYGRCCCVRTLGRHGAPNPAKTSIHRLAAHRKVCRPRRQLRGAEEKSKHMKMRSAPSALGRARCDSNQDPSRRASNCSPRHAYENETPKLRVSIHDRGTRAGASAWCPVSCAQDLSVKRSISSSDRGGYAAKWKHYTLVCGLGAYCGRRKAAYGSSRPCRCRRRACQQSDLPATTQRQ